MAAIIPWKNPGSASVLNGQPTSLNQFITALEPMQYPIFPILRRLCFTPVYHSVHRGRLSASVHAGIHTPEQTPPWSRPPHESRHPGRYGQQAGNKRAVRIPLECILFCKTYSLHILVTDVKLEKFFFTKFKVIYSMSRTKHWWIQRGSEMYAPFSVPFIVFNSVADPGFSRRGRYFQMCALKVIIWPISP